MTRRLLGTLALAAALFVPAGPAMADHDWGGGGYNDGECRGGGCGNEREEEYGSGSCKYFCPSLEDSPIHDNHICLPGSTCHFDGERRQDEQQPR